MPGPIVFPPFGDFLYEYKKRYGQRKTPYSDFFHVKQFITTHLKFIFINPPIPFLWSRLLIKGHFESKCCKYYAASLRTEYIEYCKYNMIETKIDWLLYKHTTCIPRWNDVETNVVPL